MPSARLSLRAHCFSFSMSAAVRMFGICDFSWCWKGRAVPTAAASASREMAKRLSGDRPRLGGQPAPTKPCADL